MKKVELLSPVGNIEMAYHAIHNGADAIYLAGKSYGARKYAKNFTNEELKNVIEYAHLYGVKVFVTVNTIIYENELDDALEYIKFLYINQVDALIMQDVGLISLVRKYYPNLEIHASTQCHNHNKSGLVFLKKLGIKRAVLAREMTKEEIASLKDINIEKEIFIYGALCISYSGCCLFSSLNGGRSGNRGECVGCCRLPFKLVTEKHEIKKQGDYLLSTKDLNTLNHLDELIQLGVDSFKIEGRMKSPAYVGYVTNLARKIIDAYYEGVSRKLTKEEETNLKKLFNRGFTKGFILGEANIINQKTSNHQGIEIGKVLEVTNNKIKIKITNDYLHQEDGIRFKKSEIGMIVNRLYNEKGLLTNKLITKEIGYLDKKDKVKKGDIILKTTDNELNKSLEKYTEKKIPISIKVIAKTNKPIKIEITDGENKIEKTADIVEKATNKGVEQKDFEKQLSKLGNTPYTLEKIKIEKDEKIFIRLSTLNELRRELTDELTNLRKRKKIHDIKIIEKEKELMIENTSSKKYHLHVLVRNEEQLKTCLNHDIESIYVTNEQLYQKYKNNKNIYYRIDRVNKKEQYFKNEKLLVGDLGSTYLYSKDNNVVTDYYLNVVNHANIELLRKMNVEKVTLSVELTKEQIKDILNKVKEKDKIEILLYGNIELMILKQKLEKDNCTIEDKFQHQFKTVYENNLTHIFDYKVLDKIENLKEYREIGISNYRIELLNQTKEEIENILKRIKENT